MGQSDAPYIFMIYRLLFFLILGVCADQGLKAVIRDRLTVGESIPVLENIFHITYVQNTGASFGIFGEHTEILTIITAVVLAGLIGYMAYVSIRMSKENMEGLELRNKKIYLYSLLLIATGGIGNDADRIVRGYVVDFLDFRVWPVFNLADIFICVGCVLLILYIVMLEPRSERLEKDSADERA